MRRSWPSVAGRRWAIQLISIGSHELQHLQLGLHLGMAVQQLIQSIDGFTLTTKRLQNARIPQSLGSHACGPGLCSRLYSWSKRLVTSMSYALLVAKVLVLSQHHLGSA
jgi:hypothetical protein